MMMLPHPAAAHALAVILLVAGPVWDYFHTPRLKKCTNPRAKLHEYQSILALLWCCTGLACYAAGSSIFTLHILAAHLAQLNHPRTAWGFCVAFVIIVPAIVLLPHLQALSSKEVRKQMMKRYRPLSFFLPATAAEFRWFAVLAVSAGVCEEVLFRGFLIRYLASEPWQLGFLAAVAISSAGFGANHLYQGPKEIPGKVLGGLIFCGIYLVTGNLWLPIALHMTIDLIAIPVLKMAESQQIETTHESDTQR